MFSVSSSDNEQKLVYKRILRGGEIPSNGLQKLPTNNNNRGRHFYQTEKKVVHSTLVININPRNLLNVNMFDE